MLINQFIILILKNNYFLHDMLKYIRIILAIISFLAVTLLFIDFTGIASTYWPWMAKIQLMPAILSVNVLALVFIFLLTIVFGRVYCSVICPLGIFQDIVNWISSRSGSKSRRAKRLKYTPAYTKTRLIVTSVFVILLALGLLNIMASVIAGLIEPYSAYGRIATQIFKPIAVWINNLLAGWSESRVDDYTFYRVSATVVLPILAVAVITLIVIVAFAWRGGRDYCNTICPVGTVLGYLSKFSILKPVINTEKCINCGKCARNCKAKCINSKEHCIDYTRCVDCMDCISVCSEGAISYTFKRPNKSVKVKEPIAKEASVAGSVKGTADASRRGFMFAAGAIAGSATMTALAAKTDGGLTPLKAKQSPQRTEKIVPPGSQGHSHVNQHCTGCQLCIQSCPSKVLKPNMSLDGFMQPVMDFSEGYCAIDCTKCSNICPTGAFHPLDEAMKSSIKVGTAVVDLSACISASEGYRCGSCASHCPVGAIVMEKVSEESANRMPVINSEACIGCGSCEYHCPVGTVEAMERSVPAIHVEGIKRHREV